MVSIKGFVWYLPDYMDPAVLQARGRAARGGGQV